MTMSNEIVQVQPGLECGEVCTNQAAFELVDGGYLYCWDCLGRLLRLGIVFDAAMAEARISRAADRDANVVPLRDVG